jgi:hypothetical protein
MMLLPSLATGMDVATVIRAMMPEMMHHMEAMSRDEQVK